MIINIYSILNIIVKKVNLIYKRWFKIYGKKGVLYKGLFNMIKGFFLIKRE